MEFKDILDISERRSLDYRNTIILVRTFDEKSMGFVKEQILKKTRNVHFRYYFGRSIKAHKSIVKDMNISRLKPRLEVIFVSKETMFDKYLNHISDFAMHQIDNRYYCLYKNQRNFIGNRLELILKVMKWGNNIRKITPKHSKTKREANKQ